MFLTFNWLFWNFVDVLRLFCKIPNLFEKKILFTLQEKYLGTISADLLENENKSENHAGWVDQEVRLIKVCSYLHFRPRFFWTNFKVFSEVNFGAFI